MPLTLGFFDAQELTDHFEAHVVIHPEFPGITTEAEYLAKADQFLGAPIDAATTEECQRFCADGTLGDRLRFNRVTNELGCISTDNHVRTYFIVGRRSATNPRGHRQPTNYAYYRQSCREVLC